SDPVTGLAGRSAARRLRPNFPIIIPIAQAQVREMLDCPTPIPGITPEQSRMRRLSFGVLLIALSTLVLELMLTRIFDVTLTPNLSYFVVSLAIFSFGLAGLFAT